MSRSADATIEARTKWHAVPRSKRPGIVAFAVFSLAFIFAVLPAPLPAAELEVRFDALTNSVVATGLDPALLRNLATQGEASLRPAFGVFLGDAELPILGDYEISQTALRFTPRFPFLAGRTHRIRLDVAGLYRAANLAAASNSTALTASFALPDAPAKFPKTRVTKIFPSADTLPANTLRFYIHFSDPMTRHNIARHIRLERADGGPVKGAFLEMENGLWDPTSKRLTVFLHPGRIKRGLVLNEREGPPLQAGVRYRLIVDRAAEDEEGQPLLAPFVKEFTAATEIRTTPATSQWILAPPASGSRDPFILTVDRPLDEALFSRVIHIQSPDGKIIQGDVNVDEGETRWRITPYSAWRPGTYLLYAAAELEDPAGNRPTRLFDDEIHGDQHRDESRVIALPFQIR